MGLPGAAAFVCARAGVRLAAGVNLQWLRQCALPCACLLLSVEAHCSRAHFRRCVWGLCVQSYSPSGACVMTSTLVCQAPREHFQRAFCLRNARTPRLSPSRVHACSIPEPEAGCRRQRREIARMCDHRRSVYGVCTTSKHNINFTISMQAAVQQKSARMRSAPSLAWQAAAARQASSSSARPRAASSFGTCGNPPRSGRWPGYRARCSASPRASAARASWRAATRGRRAPSACGVAAACSSSPDAIGFRGM